jgi:hypothetical protein
VVEPGDYRVVAALDVTGSDASAVVAVR